MTGGGNVYTVYKHTAPNGKIYIGITSQTAAGRWHNGQGYRKQKLFYRAIKKYGWNNISHEIIKTGISKAEAAALEIALIAEYDSTNPAKGYNNSTGGESSNGVHPSAETRKKLSDALKGKPKSAEMRKKLSDAHKGVPSPAGANHYLYGKHLSAETRKKISDAKKGSTPWNKGATGQISTRRKAVLCVEQNIIYPSQAAAAAATGAQQQKISLVCAGKRQTAGGYHWQYYSEVSL